MARNPRKLKKKTANKISIIAGTHRGRVIEVPNVPNLRPTPSRIRETLFNWIAPYLYNKTCLDWFAGSGILGMEALSRGAKHVDFIDKSPVAIKNIQQHLNQFNFNNSNAIIGDFSTVLNTNQSYDIIFIDPPYNHRRLRELICIVKNLNPKWVYLEDNQPLEHSIKDIPHFSLAKTQKAGQVYYGLLAANKA